MAGLGTAGIVFMPIGRSDDGRQPAAVILLTAPAGRCTERAPPAGKPASRDSTAAGSAGYPHPPQRLHNPLQFSQHTETPMADSSSRFGFVTFAETWNGRLAMLGFVIGLATELLTGQSILSQIGLG